MSMTSTFTPRGHCHQPDQQGVGHRGGPPRQARVPRLRQLRTDAEQRGGGLFGQIVDGGIGHRSSSSWLRGIRRAASSWFGARIWMTRSPKAARSPRPRPRLEQSTDDPGIGQQGRTRQRRCRSRRPGRAAGPDAQPIPRPKRPGPRLSSVPAGGVGLHAMATAARTTQLDRRAETGKSVVAGDQRAPALRRQRGPALAFDHPGPPSSPTVAAWLEFIRRPSAASWYRAHNMSVVSGYLEHEHLAAREGRIERFFINVVLARVSTPTRWSPRRGWHWPGWPPPAGCSAIHGWA